MMSLRYRRMSWAPGVIALLLCVPASAARAQQIPLGKRVFNEEVLRPHGQAVIPLFEGWYTNPDGTYDLCFSYMNLNTEEPVDIPLGDRNKMEPSEFDGKQPTHFVPVPGMTPVSQFTTTLRRIWCAFTVTVPADFGDKRVWWTLQREGQDLAKVPGDLNPRYVMDEPESDGRGQIAPTLQLTDGGPSFKGRHGRTAAAVRQVRVGQALQLPVWIQHPTEDQVWLGFAQYSGPGAAKFDPAEEEVKLAAADGKGMATTNVTFDAPGDYEILLQSISTTASFEFECCWTNGYVMVHVTN
jgi:hypothetical protein